MRFFKEIKRGVTNVKRGFCRGLGRTIEIIGKMTCNENIEDFGSEIISKNPPILKNRIDLNDESTSISDTIDVQKKCEEFQKEISKQGEKTERNLIESFRKEKKKLIDELAESFSQSELNDICFSLDDDFERNICNTISDYVAHEISPDNEEFVEILNMSDEVREEETKKYVDIVLKAAKHRLSQKYKKARHDYFKKLYESLESYFDSEKDIVTKKQNNLREMQSNNNNITYRMKKITKTIVNLANMDVIRSLTYDNV